MNDTDCQTQKNNQPKPASGKQESAIPGWNVDGTKREPASGTWTVERQVNTWQIVCDGRPVSHQSFDEGLMQAICDAHNAALAAAEKKRQEDAHLYERTIDAFDKQLAAERERHLMESRIQVRALEQAEQQLINERNLRADWNSIVKELEDQLITKRAKITRTQKEQQTLVAGLCKELRELREQLAAEREKHQ